MSDAEAVAPDCRGLNAWEEDAAVRSLLPMYLSPDLLAHLSPHLHRLGELVGGRLDELAETADKNPPVLHARDRQGRNEDWIEYHSAYREMETIAFSEFGLHALSHRGDVLGWPEPLPAVAKYAFQYLFVQAEFGLMCPVSVSDTSIHLLEQFASPDLKELFLPRMLSQDQDQLWKGAQFMTERTGGSDVGAIRTEARRDGDQWRLYGDKWFCSHADADVVLLLARPEGAPRGTAGLGLFAMPRRLEDGSRNSYRIVRLKDKLGTRSMASGEVELDGAIAYQVGELDRGLKQMLEQVNLSRLSHGVRAAAMMRRCLNEALQVARHRMAFGRRLIDMPLVRRQLTKLMVPTEQALSLFLYTAEVMEQARRGDEEAARLARILTPLLKFRSCRDNVSVATGAMEMRGGNGYVEDWANARLVRDAHIGVLWEGTSNIIAIDAVTRAVGREGAGIALEKSLHRQIESMECAPASFMEELRRVVERSFDFASRVAAGKAPEAETRRAATALYNAASAVRLAWEGEQLVSQGRCGRRLALARLVLDHRLTARDPLAADEETRAVDCGELLLSEEPVAIERLRDVL